MWRIAIVTLAIWTSGARAEDAAYSFVWEGAGGYEMRGAMAFDADLLSQPEITQSDLTCFVIEGTRDGAPLGRWALSMLNEETSWLLRFRPGASEFVVWGEGAQMPQAWNMDGWGTDCGPGGFGFNIGGQAQDLCVDGRLMQDSQVPPPRPFPALRNDDVAFPADACMAPFLMGALGRSARYR